MDPWPRWALTYCTRVDVYITCIRVSASNPVVAGSHCPRLSSRKHPRSLSHPFPGTEGCQGEADLAGPCLLGSESGSDAVVP